jgi:hypothetical protein
MSNKIIERLKNEKPSKVALLFIVLGFLVWFLFDTWKMFYPSKGSAKISNDIDFTSEVEPVSTFDSGVGVDTQLEGTKTEQPKAQMKYFEAISYTDVFAATQIIKRAVNEEEAKSYVAGVLSQRTLNQQRERLSSTAEMKKYEEDIARHNSEIEKLGFEGISEIAVRGIDGITNPVYRSESTDPLKGDNRVLAEMDIKMTGFSQISAKNEPTITLMVGEIRYSEIRESQRLTGGLKVETIKDGCVTISKGLEEDIFCLGGV